MVISCGTCNKGKAPDSFSPRERARGKPLCKSCACERTKRYVAGHRESVNAKRRSNYPVNKDRLKSQNLKWKYGITSDEWESLFLSQNSRCAICNTDTPKGRGWQTDHCHKSLKIRGILCHHCNSLLGHAEDKIETLEKSIKYLEQSIAK